MTWELINTISIANRVSISDSMFFFDLPIIVALPPNDYSVMVRYGQGEDRDRVLGLRVCRGAIVRRGAKIDEVLVDFAQVAVCDRDSAEAAFAALGNDQMGVYYDQLQGTESVNEITLPGEARMIVVESGYGDGSYPVFILGSSEQIPCGVEIDFALDSD